MALKLTIVNEAGAVSLIEVTPSNKISAVALMIEAELSIAADEQDLRFNGSSLSPSATVASSGLSDGDLIMVSSKSSSRHRSAAPPAAPLPPSQQALLDSLRADTAVMQRLRAMNPELASAVQAGDPNALRAVGEAMRQMGQQQQQQFADPMSADAQKLIEERIRQENVMQNMEAAMEYNPESFGSVVMLFVDCKVNSVSGVKAFVDSGAQATIISKACAERCNILRLLDSRFAGMAHGVGTAKIHGRIHLALLTLGTEVFEVSFTVMDAVGGEYDMLLGLDMLRKHQASIDLDKNCLRIGSTEVPFLSEKDIPKKMLGQRHLEPASPKSANGPSQSAAASAPPAAAASSASPSSSKRSDGGRRGKDNAISRLVEMGFSTAEAEEALRVCNGNADQAAAMLAAKKYGF